MTTNAQMRMERIERLLRELEYEVVRGMLENEIDEHISFTFIVPRSREYREGVVSCEFRTRPVEHPAYLGLSATSGPKLKLVE